MSEAPEYWDCKEEKDQIFFKIRLNKFKFGISPLFIINLRMKIYEPDCRHGHAREEEGV